MICINEIYDTLTNMSDRAAFSVRVRYSCTAAYNIHNPATKTNPAAIGDKYNLPVIPKAGKTEAMINHIVYKIT